MSSPDPLNDSTMAELASVPPSSVTRRVTRSQSSQRFLALGSSPRKQMFELQVGDRMSPQRLLVTVETDGQQEDISIGSNAKRKLFQSPISTLSTPARRLRGRTTTTTVPLRESVEEDGDDATTPKARGRQRKSNGTPMPSAGTKRRAGTPVRRTPRRLRTLASTDGEEPSSEASEEANVQTTPTPRRRNLRPRKTSRPAPSSELGTDITPRPSTARRGRRRRQALAPDELLELADEVGDINLDTTQLPPVTSEDEVDLVRAPSESTDDGSLNAPDPAPAPPPAPAVPSSPSPNFVPAVAEPDSDIWIGSGSNETTQRASARTRKDVIPESSPRFPPTTYTEPQLDRFETSQESYYGDYGYADAGTAASDRSSIDEPLEAEDPAATAAPAGYDTIAQGEDFSMIFMDSIPSLQAEFNSSVHPVVHEELGDETNLIINNTLESLRQADHDDPEEDNDAVDTIEPAEPQPGEELAMEEPLVERELVGEEIPERSATPILQSSSPNRPSPRWSRSPRKSINSSPLRHRVLKQNALQTAESPVQTKQTDKLLSSPWSDRRLRSADRLEEEVSKSYEDSFSEIPEAVLTAATPRRPQASVSYDELEDEIDQVRMVDEDDDAIAPDEDQQQVDEPVEMPETAMGRGEEHIRSFEPPQQIMEQQEDESQEVDEPEGEGVEESGEDDQAEEIGVELDHDHDEEVTSRQDMVQESESEEEMGEYDLVPDEKLKLHPESVPEQVQALPLKANTNELREGEYEYDEDGLDDAELSELETEQGAAVMDQTADADEDEEPDRAEDMVASSQLDEEGQEDADEEMADEVNEDEDYEVVDEPALVAAAIASAALQSSPSRLPTPDDTPPQAELQTADDVAEKSARGSRPPSSLRPSSISPGHFRETLRATVEQPQEIEELGEEEVPEVEEVSEEEEMPEVEEDREMEEDQQMEGDQQTEDDAPVFEKNPEGELFVPEAQQEPSLDESTRRSVDATPPQQISSPVQEPASLQHETSSDKMVRPHLSTIIRAGRVLQSITSDPPSPEGREKQLGSPFRSSGSKDSWSGSRDSQTSRRMSGSPLQGRSAVPTRIEIDNQAQQETSDSALRSARYPSFLSPVRRSKEPSVERNRSDGSPSRHSSASSMRITPPSDGVMSWVEREGPISPNLRGDNSLREAARLPELRAEIEEPRSAEQVDAPLVQAPVAEPPRESTPVVEEPEAEQDASDDETDIWELEAQRETPRSVRQRPFGKRVPTSSNRRGAIPSPWTKRSVHRPAISRMISQAVPDLSHLTEEPSAIPDQPPQSSSPDEYSRLAQSQKEEAEAKRAANASESAAKASKFDLSSFFSSPAAIPGMLAQKLMPGRTQSTVQPANPPMSMAGQAPPVVPTSSMFPQIPQKDFRPGSSNRSSLFSPARRKQPSSPLEQQEEPPEQQQQQQPKADAERPSSPTTPEQVPMPTIVQKQNFTPRPGQASNSFFHSSSNSTAAVTPPRMQLSHADIHRWTQQTSNASEASSDFQRPLLRPLPPKNASPTKSSLRSPLKPRTPGRVVEFTSSVLSPAEQAKARLDNRSAQSNSILSQDFFAPPLPQPIVQVDKENASMDDVSMDDAPPLTKPPPPEPLSQTTWSRRHWLLLDQLLQYRRSSPFPVNYTRGADNYLGKTVKSHGEAMTLDRWHLDVVDAFKAEVGGWDADVLAKRLFALILGEARRMEARERRVMFH
ncbi:hypothetical protein MAA_07612 [Metarhizium robertsii ARSEF 23]|uniref:Uncharacterized protein n=1 Tax=Metarhizium robertsii (strain ARSEF 23 / ATCC MYA-3075) TaxID=655844 RepID=E9F5R3_METRA|nr:uncharacterized protein MAA_07612 [Metarhizium robertsii ARSEF 23]EFY96799.1 hypothetical protein MAA_07612 [Metarhizium robertsii ARSEF 23]